MIFNSVDYLIFFPAVTLIYFMLPRKAGNIWLLAASFAFYMNWNAGYGLLLFSSIVITYTAARLMGKCGEKKKARSVMVLSLVLNLGMLAYFKYFGFFADNINMLLSKIGQKGLQAPDILLPVGISFYIFQAVGYTLDVYHGRITPEKNFFTYALFVSFFPQLVAGPIERSTNLLPQFREKHSFDAARIREGLMIMLWGLFIKMVIADRIALMITPVFDEYLVYSGMEIFFACVLFSIQIYCDFAGYSHIAIGSAKVLGFTLMDNFRQPLSSVSVHDFWNRWHISLTGWFRDYLYIPLGGNRKGMVRKQINRILVFLVSGLWHGAAWHYVIWGGLNGCYLMAEDLIPGKKEAAGKAGEQSPDVVVGRVSRRVLTFFLVSFAFLFFRAASLKEAIGMLRQCKADPGIRLFLSRGVGRLFASAGMDAACAAAFLLAVLLLIGVDFFGRNGYRPTAYLVSLKAPLRWIAYTALVFYILIFGIYGKDFPQTEFIYFQF
ncbi:MAG: MBOAT family protein [Lachnospiraceae bacterium]|nr:MBOAT family protein [Lachnospiraceae bacterium]